MLLKKKWYWYNKSRHSAISHFNGHHKQLLALFFFLVLIIWLIDVLPTFGPQVLMVILFVYLCHKSKTIIWNLINLCVTNVWVLLLLLLMVEEHANHMGYDCMPFWFCTFPMRVLNVNHFVMGRVPNFAGTANTCLVLLPLIIAAVGLSFLGLVYHVKITCWAVEVKK